MQKVIEKEPIISFLDRATDLKEKAGISTILVAGSSAAFFDIADTVVLMDSYQAFDITQKVRTLCAQSEKTKREVPKFHMPEFHRIYPKYKNHSGKDKIKINGMDSIVYGREEIEVRYLEQLVDKEQVSMLGILVRVFLEKYCDGKTELRDAVERMWRDYEKEGFSISGNPYVTCGYAKPRKQEFYACINRFRG